MLKPFNARNFYNLTPIYYPTITQTNHQFLHHQKAFSFLLSLHILFIYLQTYPSFGITQVKHLSIFQIIVSSINHSSNFFTLNIIQLEPFGFTYLLLTLEFNVIYQQVYLQVFLSAAYII